MANSDNLIPISKRSSSEVRDMASKGGKKSGEIRREKASFKKALQWLVDSNIKLKKGAIKEQFEKIGIDTFDMNPIQLATLGLWYGAVQGNSTNYKVLMELSGELKELPYAAKEPIITVSIIDSDTTVKEEFFKNEE